MKALFYPDPPTGRNSKVKRYIELSGTTITNNPTDKYDVAVYWSYHKTIRPLDKALIELSKHHNVINIGGWDITKSKVEAIQKKVFGYNTIVDPLKCNYEILEKAEIQCGHALHRVVKNITKHRDGCIYCKLLDNRIDNNTCRYYRYFIFGDRITHTNITDVPIEQRLKGGTHGSIKTVSGCHGLTKDEEDKIIEFCREYGTTFTELDVIRDPDGRIYVIDNNNIPGGLRSSIYGEHLYREWAELFIEMLEGWGNNEKKM